MLHPRCQFLAHIAALGKADSVQFLQPPIQSEDLPLAEISALRDAQIKPQPVIFGRPGGRGGNR